MNKYLTVFLFFTLGFGYNANAQCMVVEVPFQDKVHQSVAIVEAEVVWARSNWDAGKKNIYTRHQLKLHKTFKGIPNQEFIEIVTPGGVIDNKMERVDPSLQLNIGDIGIFMLKANDVDFSFVGQSMLRFEPIASVQSFIKYALNEGKASGPFVRFNSIEQDLYPILTSLTRNTPEVITSFTVSEHRFSNLENATNSTITSFSPTTASAGTATVLTITGSGFGASRSGNAKVEFANANDGGTIDVAPLASQYLSWSDTQIRVEIPDLAGTGSFKITKPSGGTDFSGGQLTIDYGHINVEFDPGSGQDFAYNTRHQNDNSLGGYFWQMNTDFDNDAPAKSAFFRSLELWRCQTGINWELGGITNIDEVVSDGINIIRFDNGSELPNGVLGRCTSRFNGCNTGGDNMDWFVSELDIVFNDTSNWNFGPGSPTNNQIDFESVASHELGHGHQLGHVIDPNKMMHFSIGAGDEKRTLSAGDIAGANAVQSRSESAGVCSTAPMTPYTNCSTVTATCQNITIQLNASGMAIITANDIDNGSSGSNITLSLDKTTFDCTDVGTNMVTLTITDDNANTDSCTATVTVEDAINPTAICKDATITTDATGLATITTADIDNGSNDVCGIASLSLDRTTFTCTNLGANTITLTVIDNNGNMSTCMATVTVQDGGTCVPNLDTDGDGVLDNVDNCVNDPGPASLNGCPLNPADVDVLVTDPSCPGPGKTGEINVTNNIAIDMTYTIDGINTNFSTAGTLAGNSTATINNLNPDSYWVVLSLDALEVYRARLDVVEPSTVGIFRATTTTVVSGRAVRFQLKQGLEYCQIPDYQQLESIRIYNSIGQLVEVLPFKDQFTIPGKSAGFYLIQVVDVEGNYSNHKIVLR